MNRLTLIGFIILAAFNVFAVTYVAAPKTVGTTKVSYIKPKSEQLDLRDLPKLDMVRSLVEEPKESVVKNISLESGNTVVIQGVINSNLIASVSNELLLKASLLDKEEPIYLFLDTVGGSIFAGIDFIELTKGIPNRIVTVTKFAASMGFEIVQHMDTRYILEHGILMSHRAAGGVKGQFDGELESRLKFYKDMFDRMEQKSASRMSLSLQAYKDMIVNEFWSTGFRAPHNKSADEVVTVSCGSTLNGTKVQTVQTMFGAVDVVVSKCPMISGILDVADRRINVPHDNQDLRIILESFTNPREFVQEYIKTNKFRQIFGD